MAGPQGPGTLLRGCLRPEMVRGGPSPRLGLLVVLPPSLQGGGATRRLRGRAEVGTADADARLLLPLQHRRPLGTERLARGEDLRVPWSRPLVAVFRALRRRRLGSSRGLGPRRGSQNAPRAGRAAQLPALRRGGAARRAHVWRRFRVQQGGPEGSARDAGLLPAPLRGGNGAFESGPSSGLPRARLWHYSSHGSQGAREVHGEVPDRAAHPREPREPGDPPALGRPRRQPAPERDGGVVALRRDHRRGGAGQVHRPRLLGRREGVGLAQGHPRAPAAAPVAHDRTPRRAGVRLAS
mmetsp:Transcript_72741/g.224997  ORF Transcript_72741/g.224997 Transcript_72741/m.224997 type:complete len:296 (+) Transcript_72741:421-1308(+)